MNPPLVPIIVSADVEEQLRCAVAGILSDVEAANQLDYGKQHHTMTEFSESDMVEAMCLLGGNNDVSLETDEENAPPPLQDSARGDLDSSSAQTLELVPHETLQQILKTCAANPPQPPESPVRSNEALLRILDDTGCIATSDAVISHEEIVPQRSPTTMSECTTEEFVSSPRHEALDSVRLHEDSELSQCSTQDFASQPPSQRIVDEPHRAADFAAEDLAPARPLGSVSALFVDDEAQRVLQRGGILTSCGMGKGKNAAFKAWQQENPSNTHDGGGSSSGSSSSSSGSSSSGSELSEHEDDAETAAQIEEPRSAAIQAAEHHLASGVAFADIPTAVASTQESDVNTQEDEVRSVSGRRILTNSGERITLAEAQSRTLPCKDLRVLLHDVRHEAKARVRLSKKARDEQRTSAQQQQQQQSSEPEDAEQPRTIVRQPRPLYLQTRQLPEPPNSRQPPTLKVVPTKRMHMERLWHTLKLDGRVRLHDGRNVALPIGQITKILPTELPDGTRMISLRRIASQPPYEGIMIKPSKVGNALRFLCEADPSFCNRVEKVCFDDTGVYVLAHGVVPAFMRDAAEHLMTRALGTARTTTKPLTQLAHFTEGEMELWLLICWELEHNDLPQFTDGETTMTSETRRTLRNILGHAINELPRTLDLRHQLAILYNNQTQDVPLSRQFMIHIKRSYANIMDAAIEAKNKTAIVLWETFMAKAGLHHYLCAHTNVAVYKSMVAHTLQVRAREQHVRATLSDKPNLRNRFAYKVFLSAAAALELVPVFGEAGNMRDETLDELNNFVLVLTRSLAAHLISAGIFPFNRLISANYVQGYVNTFRVELNASRNTDCVMGSIDCDKTRGRLRSYLMDSLSMLHEGFRSDTRITKRAIQVLVEFLRDILNFQMRAVIAGARTFVDLNAGFVNAFEEWIAARHTIGSVDLWDTRDHGPNVEFSWRERRECDGSEGELADSCAESSDDDDESMMRELDKLISDQEHPPLQPRGELASAAPLVSKRQQAQQQEPRAPQIGRKRSAPVALESDEESRAAESQPSTSRAQHIGRKRSAAVALESDKESRAAEPQPSTSHQQHIGRKRSAAMALESDEESRAAEPQPSVDPDAGPEDVDADAVTEAADSGAASDAAEHEVDDELVRDYKTLDKDLVDRLLGTLQKSQCGKSMRCVLCRDRSSRLAYYLSPKHLVYACRWCVYIAVTDKRLPELCKRIDAHAAAPLLSRKCGQAFIRGPIERKTPVSYNHYAGTNADRCAPPLPKKPKRGAMPVAKSVEMLQSADESD